MRCTAFYSTLLLLVVPIAVAQSKTPAWRNGSQEKMCGLGTYHDGLDLAFKNATAGAGETLVTVQVLPSFQREYALVLTRVGAQVKLLRVTFQDQLWSQLGPPLHTPNTRQHCLELAMAARVETAELSVPVETTKQLWTAFSNINLDTDTCPRRKSTCALFLDGTDFVIQTNDGRLLRLTEITGLKGIKSENAALLHWVHALLQSGKNPRP